MKMKTVFQSVIGIVAIGACLAGVFAQDEITPRQSPYAEVVQRIGTTDVKITYHRPGVKGRTIWGELVPYSSESPWRAGANNATAISVSKDVKIDGKTLPKGEYALYFFVEKDEWTLAINTNAQAWGAGGYDAANDVLRATLKPVEAPMKEWLTYDFDDLSMESATAYLHWEKLKAPFTIQAG